MRRLFSFAKSLLSLPPARRSQTPRRTTLRLEQLEDRLTPSAGIREQYMLELINRMRENPAAELTRLLNVNDADVNNALSQFGVDRNVLAQQWATLTPAAPLAWSDAIAAAAQRHSQTMLDWDRQEHQLPGESSMSQRMIDAGWDITGASWSARENIFAFAESVFHGHAALAIDWGFGPSGIQSPAGHRDNIMNASLQEVGIGIVDATAGKTTGPLLITQDFGFRSTVKPFLLGVVYQDSNQDGFYSMGEGLNGVSLNITGPGGNFNITTSPAGGYQLQLPAGTYTVTANGGGLSNVTSTVTIGNANVRLAFVATNAPAAPATPTMTGPASANANTTPTFTWTASSGAARYDLWVDNLSTGQRQVIRQTNVTATSFKSPIKLPAGNYRAWVKAYDGQGQGSEWSAPLNFTLGAPATPKMTAPTSATTATAPKFTWTASSGATRYDLWVDNLTTGQREVIRQTNLTTTSYVHATGLSAGTYRVWVRAYSNLNLANAWSAPLTFTVASVAPLAPKMTAPTGGTTVTMPQFAWSASLSAVRYELWVNNLTTGQLQVIHQTNLTATSFTATSLLTAGKYRAWVRAFDDVGQASPWSAYRAFTVKGAAPSVPVMTGPANTTTALAPTFSWTAPLGAARYDLWVDNLSTGVRQVIRQTSLTANSFTPAMPLVAGNYRVWVRAFDSTGVASAWSINRDFTVTAPVIASTANLGQKAVDFAAARLGQQVGSRGECTDLVEAALQAAGAKTTADFGVTGLDADYVWGDLVATYRAGDDAAILANLRPGDIIQYRNVEIREGGFWWSFPHHSAIVKQNLGGGRLTILEQNVNGERWVHETTTNLAAMTSGVVWIYRPVQK